MEVLRTAVSVMGSLDPNGTDNSLQASYQRGVRLVAQLPTVAAYFHRLRSGQVLVAPQPDLSNAANFLAMLSGSKPDEESARIFDTALVLHADQGFNASTFAARVIASTESDLYSAIAGALGALKGPLHGGANESVLRMLLKIGEVDQVDGYVNDLLSRRERVPGFGHRVYKTMDPRAAHLKLLSKQLSQRTGEHRWYEMSVRIQDLMMQKMALDPNVDFYSASVYHYLGIPTDLFTPIFAMSRVSGWAAHVLEQYQNNRLFRPRELYIGKKGLTYVPLQQR